MLGQSEFMKWCGWRWWQDRMQEAWSGSMLNISGVSSVGLGHKNDGHRFLARLEVRHCSQQESRLNVEERRCRRGTCYKEGSARVCSRVGWWRQHGRWIDEQGKSDVDC